MKILSKIKDARVYLKSLESLGWKPGLERIEKLVLFLNNPEKKYKTIYIGGTNGKGSVTTSIANILISNNYNVGKFTSPELFSFNERIQINDVKIDNKNIINCLNKIIKAIDKLLELGYSHPTHFEVITVLAFLYFAESKIDIAVIEVGLGGDLDATNVIKPIVSVITNVTIDHTDFLGKTVEDIARIKSGIIKKNTPVVTASNNNKVLNILIKKAKKTNSKIFILGKDFSVKNVKIKKTETIFNFISSNINQKIHYSLLGFHQVENCAIVLQVLNILIEKGIIINIKKSLESLKSIIWKGRLEIYNIKNKKIIIDAAHNQAGVNNLSKYIKKVFSYKKLILILGILDDKDREAILKEIGPLANIIIVTKPKNPRTKLIKKVIKEAEKYSSVIYEKKPVIAFENSIKIAKNNDLICITGSIYIIKDILFHIEKKYLKK